MEKIHEVDPATATLTFVVDQERRIQYVEDSGELSLGCDLGAAEHPPCWKVLDLRLADGTPFCRERCPAWDQIGSLKSNGEFGPLILRRDHREIPVHLSILALRVPHDDGVALLHRLSIDSAETQPGAVAPCALEHEADHSDLNRIELLTRRETEVLHLLSSGRNSTEIAAELSISPLTVRNHLRSSMEKLGVHRRLDAVLIWLKGAQRSTDRPRRLRDQGTVPINW